MNVKIENFEQLCSNLGKLVREGWLKMWIRNDLTGISNQVLPEEKDMFINIEKDLDTKNMTIYYTTGDKR